MKAALKELQRQSRGVLPEGDALARAYNHAMERIDGQLPGLRLLARKILSWITCAQQQLTVLELQHALAINAGDTQLDRENLRDIQDMVSLCAGLVTVDEKSGIIRLVHYTTQEYFEQTGKVWFPEAESDITICCVTYLSFNAFENGCCETYEEYKDRLRSNPFYKYAVFNWGHHARKATPSGEVVKFLKSKAKVEAATQVMFTEGIYRNTYFELIHGVTGLHLAAYFGVDTAVRLLDGGGPDIEDYESRTPLSYAAENGHEVVVQRLLEMDADNNSKSYNGRSPISFAAENGHLPVVKLLLDSGAAVDWHDNGHDNTPLAWAADSGHEAIMQLLLDAGADIEAKAQDNWTPLLYAAVEGHQAAVRLLLDRGADIEAKYDWGGQTPLSLASEYGHEEVVRLLLEKGADMEAKDKDGRTPLSWATEKGQGAVVRLLLEKGAASTPRISLPNTPLLVVAEVWYEAVVRLLLENDADIKAKNKADWTMYSGIMEE